MRIIPTNRREGPPDGIRAAAFARLRAQLELTQKRAERADERITTLLAENREHRAAISRMRSSSPQDCTLELGCRQACQD